MITTKTRDALDILRDAAAVPGGVPGMPPFEVRGVVLVRDPAGRPKFDRPMHEYPDWAQVEFWAMLSPAEREEFF